MNVDLLLGMIPSALQLVLLVILLRRKLHKQFPFFCSYTLYSIAATILRQMVLHQRRTFFTVYWTTDIVYGVFELLVIREVFLPSLEGFPEKYRWVRWIVPVALSGIIALALWNSFNRAYGQGPLSGLAAGAYSFEISIRWLELFVFLAAIILDRRGWVPLLICEFGILSGLGFAALLTLVADIAGLHYGSRFETVFRYLPTSAYIGATGAWLLGFLYKEPKPGFRLTDEKLKVMEDSVKRQHEILDKLRGKDKSPRLTLC